MNTPKREISFKKTVKSNPMYFPKIYKSKEPLLSAKLIQSIIGGRIFLASGINVNAVAEAPSEYTAIEIYICSDEKPKDADMVLTDNYGIWEFREQPSPLPY